MIDEFGIEREAVCANTVYIRLRCDYTIQLCRGEVGCQDCIVVQSCPTDCDECMGYCCWYVSSQYELSSPRCFVKLYYFQHYDVHSLKYARTPSTSSTNRIHSRRPDLQYSRRRVCLPVNNFHAYFGFDKRVCSAVRKHPSV